MRQQHFRNAWDTKALDGTNRTNKNIHKSYHNEPYKDPTFVINKKMIRTHCVDCLLGLRDEINKILDKHVEVDELSKFVSLEALYDYWNDGNE